MKEFLADSYHNGAAEIACTGAGIARIDATQRDSQTVPDPRPCFR